MSGIPVAAGAQCVSCAAAHKLRPVVMALVLVCPNPVACAVAFCPDAAGWCCYAVAALP